MNIDVISEVISHLDINEYEEVGNGLPDREQKRIAQYWKMHTKYYVIENEYGKFWLRNNKQHRDGDLPAVEFANGDKFWFKNGLRHCDNDLPAVEYKNGPKYWYKNNKLHRDNDLPAIEYANGRKVWYRNGEIYYPS